MILAGRYRLGPALGHGGMAVVHAAHDDELDRPVAVKLLAENLSADSAVRERFEREARHAARLQHANIVSVYDTGEAQGRPFIVMEFVDGESLADLVRRRGRLPAAQAIAIVRQAAAGVAHAHRAGIVHRDVKPQNVLVRADGAVKVVDFGIARAAEETTALTQTGTVLGTASYLAPEQAAGAETTPATDVYGLGAVLYELLTGRPPRAPHSLADLVRQLEAPIEPPSALAPDVPANVERFVMRALAAEPSYRPRDGAEFERELAQLDGNASTDVIAPPAPTRVHPPGARPRIPARAWAVLASLIVTLAIVGAIAVGTTGSSKSSRPPQRVEPVARGADAESEARNLAAWLRRYSR